MYRYKDVYVSIHISVSWNLDWYVSNHASMIRYIMHSLIFERSECVSIHASMIRYTGDSLPLRDHFCIDTSDRCIDTNCTKSVWSNFRTFVSIHMFMYRYIIPKTQFFKVLKIVFRCQVICNVAKMCSTLFSCVLTIIKTWGWTGALTYKRMSSCSRWP